jgi:AcrR family transcriptional regulator
MAAQQTGDAGPRSLWFTPPDDDAETGRRLLTRERVVAEALAAISADGAQALSMRAIAARLGVVPGALYRHVRSKEQLYDLVLDEVLAEAAAPLAPAAPWHAEITALARRLRAALENHPGTAALLKDRDPVSPAALALAEAFLAPLRAAGLPGHRAALAFRLLYDYTAGFALADPTSPAEQRLHDTATRHELHAFLRSLPVSQFPALAAHGTDVWANDRDQRFNSGLGTLLHGLQAELRPGDGARSKEGGRR